jgi:hypothetical protein
MKTPAPRKPDNVETTLALNGLNLKSFQGAALTGDGFRKPCYKLKACRCRDSRRARGGP